MQRGQSKPVLVLSVGVADLGVSLLVLCLGQFHNRAKTHLVARLRQLEGKVRLIQHLLGDRDSLIRRIRREPGGVDVADDAITEIAGLFRTCLCAQRCLLGLRRI